ncbi:hypothetical protein EDD32_3080 [Georgenia muralis]|uniref:Uncharacterized protein n=2 Tax=Georgenia muralis TaxID=154117 RepID=A0A3N4ZSQ1_9MICO|nr:DUF5335 family protein [Georgenia muralis]RPF28548.1 hypothetical protein EDD32_3080 [Georgenia muralis]
MTSSPTTDHDEWMLQLDKLTRDRREQYVTIEILHPEYGDQPEAEHLPFAYAMYDPKDDVVVIAVGGNTAKYPVLLRHLIAHPTEVEVDVDDGALKVVEKDGTTTIVGFHGVPAQM